MASLTERWSCEGCRPEVPGAIDEWPRSPGGFGLENTTGDAWPTKAREPAGSRSRSFLAVLGSGSVRIGPRARSGPWFAIQAVNDRAIHG